jgi:hypothetical protein
MNDKLNYQQAKRLREQSLTSVFSDQLIMGEGYGSAIGKTISLKTKAKIAGIKQKFDPLNIAKILTGGSRLGPAILGKMLGRSRRDIEFFAGRARPVTTRQKRIGTLPGSGEDTTGMSVVLDDILTFLRKSHEDDMILREKENNLREGEKHEDERRHKKLIKALEKVGLGGTATKVKPTGPGMFDGIFDSIKKFVQDMIDKALQVFEWVKDLKPFMRFIGSRLLNFLLSPGMLALSSVAIGALIAMGAKEIVEAVGQQQIDTAKDLLERNKNRESLSEEDKVKLDDEIAAAGGLKKLNQVMETANNVPIEQRVITPRPDTTGGKNKASADKWDYNFGKTHNPDGTPKALGYVSDAEQIASMNKVSSDTSVNDAEMKKLQRQNDMAPPAPPATQTPTSAALAPQAPASAAVSSMSTENQNLNIQAASKSMTVPKTNTNVVNKNNMSAPKPRAPIIAVRNAEPTFAQAIYNSTRVV